MNLPNSTETATPQTGAEQLEMFTAPSLPSDNASVNSRPRRKLRDRRKATDELVVRYKEEHKNKLSGRFEEPRIDAGILFLDPRTPDDVWSHSVERDSYVLVYVQVSDALKREIEFAKHVREAMPKNLADPVVIGPVNSRMMRHWQTEIDKAGLRISPKTWAQLVEAEKLAAKRVQRESRVSSRSH